jgi:hypothetical protein
LLLCYGQTDKAKTKISHSFLWIAGIINK